MQNRIGHFAFCTLHFALCTALIVLALLVGGRCGRVRTKEPLIDGFLFKEAYVGYPTSYDRWIEVYDEDGLPQIPTATYNGQQLEMISWNPNHTIYEDTSAFKSDTTCDMEVEHYWGRAWLRLNMPADFRITQPDSSYVFDRDSGLTVSWQKSRGATWYWLVIYLAYDFTDTLGGQGYYQFVKDTILSDTVCVFEPNRFFPPLVRDVLRGEGQAVMWSADGPQTTIGAANNVQGHGYGYVSAANQPEEAYFTVAHPPTTPMDRTEPGRRARESFVRRLRQMTGISDTTRSPGRRRP